MRKHSSLKVISLLLTLASLGIAQASNAVNVCANCYWGTSCGFITTDDVVRWGLVNDTPGWEGGPFSSFACDNGRRKLGVLWTNKDCGEIGGLSGLNSAQFSISNREECEFGR